MGLLSVDFILTGFLIFVRITSLVMTAPFFDFATIPARIKLFTGLVLTVALFPVIPIQHDLVPQNPQNLEVLLFVVTELLTGVMMGLAGQIILGGIHLGSELLSVNIGLSFANIIDPVTQNHNGIIGRMLILLALLIFLAIGGLHMYIQILAHSFDVIPLGMASPQGAAPVLIEMAVYMFKIGVQLASPFIVVLFLLDLSFAIFARIMPQANIFFIALPLKIGIGVLMLMLITPYIPGTINLFFEQLWRYLSRLFDVI